MTPKGERLIGLRQLLTTAALQGWGEAGAVTETAHRTPLPVGWIFWSALILLPAVVVCFLVH